MRPYQNVKTAVSQTYMYDPNQKAAMTHRETTGKSKLHMNVNRNQRGGAYEVTKHQGVENARMDTGDFYYAGNAGAGDRTRAMKSYEAEMNQRNNDIKSSTIQGRLVPGNMKLLNNNVNVEQAERDTMLKNERPVMGMKPYQGPSSTNMGISSMDSQSNYSGIGMERSDPSIIHALKSNPYAVDHKKYL
jgi:hypothetical protein